MSDSGYEMLEHTADVRIRAFGPTIEELFKKSAHGLAEYLFGIEVLGRSAAGREAIYISSLDITALLVDWLAELLYRGSVERRAYIEFVFHQLTPTELEAEALWCSAEAIEEIKAVTYHGLVIDREEQSGRWQATVTYDL